MGSVLRRYAPLLVVVLVAFVVRLVVIGVVHPECGAGEGLRDGTCFVLTGDTEYVVLQARALGDGQGFVDAGAIQFGVDGGDRPGATHPPMYTIVMATWQQVGIDGVTAWRVAMALVGSIGAGLLGLAAWRLAAGRDRTTGERSRLAGTLAGAIAAVDPLLWTRDTDLLVEALLIPLLGLVVVAALRLWRAPTPQNAALLGALVGVAWLTRSEQILLLVWTVPLFLRGLDPLPMRARVGRLAISGLVAAAVVAPWSLHNQARFERPVPLSTNGGLALLFGTCDDTYVGESFAYYDWWCVESVVVDPAHDASVHDRQRLDAALAYIAEHPERTALVAAGRFGRTWRLFAPIDTTEREAISEGVGWIGAWANLAALVVLGPLAVIGGVALRRERLPISPLVGPILTSSLIATVLIPLPRFRVPADAAIVVLATFGILALRARARSRASPEPAANPAVHA